MKMLLAQEMSKEIESKRKQPNVVARLMGLDEPLPARQSFLNGEGKLDKSGRSRSSHLKDGHFDRVTPCQVHSCTCEVKYRDVYEVHPKNQPPQKGMCDEIQNERRMALVRQKFMEAKRLAMDERLLQSKEFQDAVEVLSSNRDLFLKFLEEPQSLFSTHLKELHSAPSSPQTKRITILKPSKTLGAKGECRWDEERRSSGTTQSTRIVILKPSPVKCHDAKPMKEKDGFYHVLHDSRSSGYRQATEGQMTESVRSIRRDEFLLSSVLSNGYIGDESSFNKSETEFEREEDGNFSDSTQTSQHSWDYSNRFESPYSISSFSRASYCPEPSMIREAKKQLSERWALVASNLNRQEQIEMQKSSSTLGEMLGIRGLTSRSYGGDEDLKVPGVCSSTCQTNLGDDAERSNFNLLRSKSVPASSLAYENIGLNSEVPDSQVKKPVVTKDASKSKKSGRSIFKGKVSSLFFSRNKKGDREKSVSSTPPSGSAEPASGEGNGDHFLHPVCNTHPNPCSPLNSYEDSIKGSYSALIEGASKQGTISLTAVLSLEKEGLCDSSSDNQNEVSSSNKINENQNQPSPSSVLDGPSENDISNSAPNSSEICSAQCSSAPTDSVAPTSQWDDTNLDASTPDALLSLVRHILSAAGLNNKFNTMFSKWHSVDNPLDPILLNKFLDQKEENAESRERRSSQRLGFDCVNSALLEAGRACIGARKKHRASTPIEDEVCLLMKDWFFGEQKLESGKAENNSPVVDRLLRKEVGGSGWVESMQSEIDEISREIGGEVLKDLVAEALECLSL